LTTLSLAHRSGIHVDGLNEAINDLLTEYMKAAYRVDGIVHWPGRITFEQYVGHEEVMHVPHQMSWCYGSIGVLRAIYLASVYTANREMENFAIDELVKIAQMEVGRYLLSSPIICHGFAGTVSIMDEMYRDTGNTVFLDAARQQAITCVDCIINTDYSYIEPDPTKKVHLYSYLEGFSGILQTIQSFVGNGGCLHKKRILVL